MINRREFLAATAASGISKASAATIRKITLAPMECRFHKFVAMNSYDKAPKGHTYTNTIVRIATDQGVEGVGVMGYALQNAEFERALKNLIGVDPAGLYERGGGYITGRSAAYADLLSTYRHLDGPLFDLIGKLESKPAWRLIGPAARDRVEVYDGTLYFSDVWFRDRGARAVVEEAEEAQKSGYSGVKLKIGRGRKWMDREAGVRRDIEVTNAVRRAVGPQMKVLVDANNGYQDNHEGLWRYISETAGSKLYWLEEMIPENVAQYTDLRARMESAGVRSLIADGESVRDIKAFEPYLRPKRLVDVVQMDIRTGGIVDSLAAAKMAEPAGATSVPHNWGSMVGMLMGLHVSKAVKAITAAEDDRSTCDVLIPDGYDFRDGMYSVPEKPGLSLRVDEAAYNMKCKAAEVTVS